MAMNRAGPAVPLCVLVAVALNWLGCGEPLGKQPAKAEEAASALPVDVVVVAPAREDLERQVVLPASIEAFETTTLYSKVSGYLGRIDVDIGDKIGRGQLIAKIEVPEIVDQLREAEADLSASQADRKSAESELESFKATSRLQQLTFERVQSVRKDEPDVISQQAVDEARAEFEVARAAVRVAESRISQIDSKVKQVEAAIRRLQTLIGFSEVRAPFSGIVTNRYVHTGALLQAATSSRPVQGIVTIASLDRVRLFIDVPESEAPFVQAGDPAVATLDSMPGREFRGEVTRFAGVLNASTRKMRTEIHLANPRWLLRPGMYGRANLTLDARSDTVTIPAEALRGDAAGAYVYRVVDGRAKRTEVEAEIRDGIKVEVTSGLSGNERIVLAARGPIADSVPVTAVEFRSEEQP